MTRLLVGIALIIMFPIDALAKCKIKYDDNGIASSRYFSVATWSTGAAFRFSKYGASEYLFDVRLNKGVFPWSNAEFNAKSWVRIRVGGDEITMNPFDVTKSARRLKISTPWDSVTESRYLMSEDFVVRIANQDVTSIEVRALDPNGEEHTTIFEMKPKWVKKLKERATCITDAEAMTEELPPTSID